MTSPVFTHRSAPMRAFAFFCAVTLSACATDEAATRPTGPVIKKIEIEGAEKVDDGDIKDKILTTESPWYSFLPFTEKERFDPNAWQADLRRIERYYEAQGYYQAEVLEDRIVEKDGDAVDLFVRVREGEPTTIADLQITGLDEIDPGHKAAALEDLPLEKGKIFFEDQWAGVKGLIASRLKELGYAEATVKGEVAVDLATRTANVSVQVTPGKRYKFGNIFVAAGARPKVPQKWVIEQVQESVEPDAWYSESALNEGQARVFKMGVFGGVKVNRGAPDREAGTVPVVVDVREAPFHTIKLGAGGGVDQARNEIRAVAEYSDRNFFGGLRRLTTRAKVGYAFIPNVYGVATGVAGAQSGFILDSLAELEQPRFLNKPDLRAQVSVGLERGIEPAYNFFGGRGKLGVIWQPHPDFSIFPSYNFEGYLIEGQALLGGTTTPNLLTGCTPKTPGGQCPIALSYLEQVIEWDRRDEKLEPKNGYYFSLSLQEGGGPFATFTYLRVVPDMRGYISFLDNKLTVAGKVKLGSLYPLGRSDVTDREIGPDDSPIINRFFSGGGNSHRGFNNRRLSPLQVVAPPAYGDKSGRYGSLFPIGGNGLVETSVELRYNVSGNIVLATFLDSGMVTREPLTSAPLGPNLQHAVGIGFRYRTLVGPIRIDLARRLPFGGGLQTTPSGIPYETDNSCFGFGGSSTPDPTFSGSPEGVCTFHLSIGEAF